MLNTFITGALSFQKECMWDMNMPDLQVHSEPVLRNFAHFMPKIFEQNNQIIPILFLSSFLYLALMVCHFTKFIQNIEL